MFTTAILCLATGAVLPLIAAAVLLLSTRGVLALATAAILLLVTRGVLPLIAAAILSFITKGVLPLIRELAFILVRQLRACSIKWSAAPYQNVCKRTIPLVS